MREIEYGRDEWKTDEAAANAEALRRAEITRDYADPEARKTVWYCDLGALTVLPEALAQIDGLERLLVGDGKTPDGVHHAPEQKLQDISILSRLLRLRDLNLADCGNAPLPTLGALTLLQNINLSHSQLGDISGLSGATGLQSVNLAGSQVSDISALSGATGLQSVDLSESQVRDLGALSGATGLQSVDLSESQVSDISALSGATGLQVVDLFYSQVSDISALSGATGLQSVTLTGSQVSDLSVLLHLPHFANLTAKRLTFAETPLARSDRRWQMLAGLDGETAAADVVLYLRGEHPDLQAPLEGAQHSSGEAAIAAGAVVDLVERDGRAELADAAQFQPPAVVDAPAYASGLDGLRAFVPQLAEDLEQAANVPAQLPVRVARYAAALAASDTPTLTTLEATMVMIRGACADEYTRQALDSGTLVGLDYLIAQHDKLGATPAVPEVLPALPDIPENRAQRDMAADLVDKLGEAIAEAKQVGFVGNTIVIAQESTVDIVNSINSPHPPATPDEATQRRGLWSWALRMSGGLVWAMEAYGKVHGWSLTPAGAAIMQRLVELLALFKTAFFAG